MKNKYTIIDDEVTVVFVERRNGSILSFLIDTDDLPLVDKTGTWHVSSQGKGYASVRRPQNGPIVPLHRLLLELSDDWKRVVGDHINCDRLDNRRSNLRVVSGSINAFNRTVINKTSGYTGITWFPKLQKWRVRLSQIVLGYRTDLEDAVELRQAALYEVDPISAKNQRISPNVQ